MYILTWVGAALIGALAIGVAACGSVAVKNPSPTPSVAAAAYADGMKIAVLVPLTGDVAPVGEQLVNAAAIAVFENGDETVELLTFDTKGTPQGAAEAAADARAADVDMILGPLFGRHVQTVQQAFAGSGTTLLAFTNDLQQAGGEVFITGLNVTAQVERAIGFLADQGREAFVVIGPDNEYTARAIEAATVLAPKYNANLVRTAVYPEGADFNTISAKVQAVTDYRNRRAAWAGYESQLIGRVRAAENPAAMLDAEAARFGSSSLRGQQLSGMARLYRQFAGSGRNRALAEVVRSIEGIDAMPVDDYRAILLPIGDDDLIAIGSMLDLYNAGRGFVQLAGTDIWLNLDLSAEPSMYGAWFTQVDETALQPFSLAYRNSFQETLSPLRLRTVVGGYHGARVALAAKDARKAVTPEFVRRPKGFDGLAGKVRFGADNLLRQPLSIYEVTPDGSQELDADGNRLGS